MNIKVKIEEKEYWWLNEGDGTGAIAPLEHCDEEGNLKPECAFEISFAHVYQGGRVQRFHKEIGNISDFIIDGSSKLKLT